MDRIFRVGLAWETARRYGEDAIRGIAEYAARYGPWKISMNPFRDFDTRHPGVESRFDGILLGHDNFQAVRTIEWPRNIPVIAIHRMFSEVAPWRVQPDNIGVGRLVAEEFGKRGFRNFAYCQSMLMPTPDWDEDRIAGFSQAARRVGNEPMLYQGPKGTWRTEGYGENHTPISDWLRSLPKPIGIMAADDLCARHLMYSAEAIGIRVPEEVAVIGVNNEAWTEVLFGGLSSVELDGYRAGYAAAELLHQIMSSHRVKPGPIFIPPRRLIVRRSSSTVAISDPDVVLAVRFIAERATSGLSVERVVDAVPLSRRTLERRFQESMGRSILLEIRGVQIARAKLLLGDETISLQKVARVSGFTSVKAMTAIFRRMTGMTPTQYRDSFLSSANSATPPRQAPRSIPRSVQKR